ncbi:hypothetical protein AMJ39_01975 [candidate division TA06 bacterium DG_24]|uniref:Uncharacterized protein n=3 Tax=Bacteria division TA06 TaxID=1156500 RepID=A0A0S8JQ94_UNCT6|nr:MAG: hypothetical protein AMJ39_01975 [candidate division TA06 bacterium DG_24]KPK69485.1 MAG: hypothetical protein AMJ82_05435 [candidate division TA06 bacterium SM23_40]KPL10814.1 MAG: hypothetical protein AMJ71_01805 [candidate division TA06 bacterium SM1_40]
MAMTTIGIWVAAILTLAIYSFLYRDNPIYKLAEHILVGVSLGYFVGLYWHTTLIPKLWVPLVEGGNVLVLVPLAMGLLMLTRFSLRWSWLSRVPMAFVIGAGAGVSIPTAVDARVYRQIEATMIPLTSLSSVILVVGVAATLVYFLFSVRHEGALGKVATLGTWFLMVGFGATFGYTVMARISLLIGRMQFLLGDWLHLLAD